MKLHEFQAKKILENFKIPVPPQCGIVSDSLKLPLVLKKAGTPPWIIKAQVHAGGRGKAGGIRIAKNKNEAKKIVSEMLGMKLVTAQTGTDGLTVKKVLIEKPLKVKKEFYMSITLDRRKGCPVLIASSEGGIEIETLARTSPEKIVTIPIHPILGLQNYQARDLLFRLSLYDSDQKESYKRIQFLKNLINVFLSCDASLVEINPLALTNQNELVCLDAKLVIDDSAVFRHPELQELAAEINKELNSAERQAHKSGISYIPLNGQIGCMVNGAGLAMATMDLIKQHGGEPANFLDVGGGANVEQVTTAFKLILSDKKVKAIIVNIFGGIMKCDTIAQGIISAVKQIKLSGQAVKKNFVLSSAPTGNVPLVVRLQGNRVTEGQKLLSESGLNIISINDLAEAAKKVVELAKN